MCGIAGVFQQREFADSCDLVTAIVEDQHARGPDHRQVEVIRSRGVESVLGSNRLSILDLSDNAHMPMHDREGRHVIVFNGLVYNYLELRRELEARGATFRTSGDTEVVLEAFRAWGIEAFSRFNGMFAIAIFDREAGILTLARDRFGVKPLYYRAERDRIVFASTGRVIARHFGLAPDLVYVARGLDMLIYDNDSEISQYDGLKALRPGHVLSCNFVSGGLEVRRQRYYDLESRVASLRETLRDETDDVLAERIRTLLQDAVALRLRTDVGYGVSLSGGLDSTTVAALVAGNGKPPQGFSFGSPDAVETEGPAVRRFARHSGISVEYVWPSPEAFASAYWKTLEAQDAPFSGLSVVAQNMVFARARSRGVKVLLGGQGGDEAFMGYRKFHFFHLQKLFDEKQFGAALFLLCRMIPMFVGGHGRLGFYWQQRHRYMGKGYSESLLRLPVPGRPEIGLADGDLLWQRQVKDITDFSLPTLLRYEDRNSMGNSIESRLPFLDYRLVELGIALPVHLKIRGGHGKWIIRDLMKSRLPDSIRLARYKRGFDVDRSGWIEGGLGTELRRCLLESRQYLGDFLQSGTDIEAAFSDARLRSEPKRTTEATTLLWLAQKVHGAHAAEHSGEDR